MDLASQAGPSQQTRPMMDVSSTASNAEAIIQAEEDKEGILKFLKEKTPDIETSNATGIAGGGSGAAFSQKDYKQFFTKKENRGPTKYFEAKINMLWVGTRRSTDRHDWCPMACAVN